MRDWLRIFGIIRRHMHRPQFPTTDWDAIAHAGCGGSVFDRLLAQYLPAMRWHLCHSRKLSTVDADDILQEFVVVKLIEAKLFDLAQPDRGRFRSFLLVTLNRFTIDFRRRHANSGCAGDAAAMAAVDGDQLQAFERAWARSVVMRAIEGVQAEFSDGRERYWRLFNDRIVGPLIHGIPKRSYANSAEQGFASPREASNALVTAKRCFQRHLLQLADVGELSATDAAESLLAILSTRCAGSDGGST